jgi:hypothetical protein
MVMESAEWAVSSPSDVHPPIALGGDQGAEGTSNRIAVDKKAARCQEYTSTEHNNQQNL